MERSKAAVGVACALAVGVLWWLGRDGRRGSGEVPREEVPAAGGRPPAMLAPQAPVPEDRGAAIPAAEAPSARAVQPASAGARTRARLHGRLVVAGTGAPLGESLRLRVRSGMTLAETIECAPDGTFRSAAEFPRGLVLVRVFRPSGDEAVDHEGYFDPAAEEELVVPVPWSTLLYGRVLDHAGQPLRGVELTLSRRSPNGKSLRVRSKFDGEFQLDGVGVGRATLYLAYGLERAEFPLDVVTGPNALGELRTSFGHLAGAVGGRLRAADGEACATLLLLDRARGFAAAAEADGEGSFLFEGVPPGDYRLELLACDGRQYEPTSLRVVPPATELEFVAVGRQDSFALRGPDGRGDFYPQNLVRVRGHWLVDRGAFARADVERWVVLAWSHRAASGERPEANELRVSLEPGFGRAYLIREAGADSGFVHGRGLAGRALAGVEVIADGRAVATSGGDGFALVNLERAPSGVEFRLPGWTLLRESADDQLTQVELTRY